MGDRTHRIDIPATGPNREGGSPLLALTALPEPPAQPSSRKTRMTASTWRSVGTQARWHGFRVDPTLCRLPLGAMDTKLSPTFKLASVVMLMAERDDLSRYTW
jgi:hypothetical protein